MFQTIYSVLTQEVYEQMYEMNQSSYCFIEKEEYKVLASCHVMWD